MIIGSETKTFTGYWKKDFEGTIVPGGDFDDRSWWFQSRDRVLHLCKGETIHGTYPRDIVLDESLPHPHDFMTSLEPKSSGKRASTLFPMPDSCFVWHDTATPKAHVTKPVVSMTEEPATTADFKESERNDDPLSTTVYVWSQPETQIDSRKNKIIAGIKTLCDYHHISGHRSHEHTAL